MTLALFPEMPIGWGSKKTIKWRSKVITSASGKRKAMTSIAFPEIAIESSLLGLTQAQVEIIIGFICSRYGRVEPFLWRDPEDYSVADIQLGIGNNSTSQFQLARYYGSFKLPVTDVIGGSLSIFIDNTKTTDFVLLDNGIINFRTPPHTGKYITAKFEYYWRVAFAEDETEVETEFMDINKISSIKLVTVR